MSIVTLWNVLFAVLREFSVIYSWSIQKTERIQNKYEIERDYIKDKKSQFSILNLTTTELSFRPFREFSKTECARSLSFFCICIAFIFVGNLLFFSPALYAFCFVRFYSSPFLSRSRVPFVWYDFYSRIRVDPIWQEKNLTALK